MLKRIVVVGITIALVLGAANVVINGYRDFAGISAPSNPAAGFGRVYFNSGTGLLACLTSSGTSCLGGGGGSTRGTFASAPTCNAGAAGTTYYATDAGLNGQCNGTSWFWFYGWIPANPTNTSASPNWFNEGTFAAQATVTNSTGGAAVTFVSGGNIGGWIQGRTRAYPATPFTYIVCGHAIVNPQFAEHGLFLNDGTKAVVWGLYSLGATNASFGISTYGLWTNATTASSSYTPTPAINSYVSASIPKCFAMSDNGTTRKMRISFNKTDWSAAGFADVSNTAFLTPTQIGYYGNSNGGQGNVTYQIFSEEVVASAIF